MAIYFPIMTNSLQTRLFRILLALAAVSVVTSGVVATAFGYWNVLETRAQILEKYLFERGEQEDNKFVEVQDAQSVARNIFWKFYANLPDDEIEAGIEAYFPVQPDGTRRSIDELFDGIYLEQYGPVNGMGVLLPNQTGWTNERARIVYAAFLTILRVGSTLEDKLESLWFYTPDGDLLVFSPNRVDRLEFYRKTSPPDFNVAEMPLSEISSFEANPDAKTRCTPLTDIAYMPKGEGLTTGCQTPVRREGTQFGVFGTTLPLSAAFHEALNDVPQETANLYFMRTDGDLIAHKGLLAFDQVTWNEVNRLEDEFQTRKIAERIKAEHLPAFTFTTQRNSVLPDLDAAYHLEIPDWYLVISIPGNSLLMDVVRQLIPLFGLSIFMVLLSMGILGYLVRTKGIKPLQTLAAAFGSERLERRPDPKVLAFADTRKDEIGDLARTLVMYKSRTDDYLSELEKLVEERTSEINRSNEAKTAFLATMSHELRTPLNGILGVAGALKRTSLTPQQMEMTELVWQSSEILERQLSDILDISKVEAGKLELDRSACNVSNLIKTIFDLNSTVAEEKSIEYTLDVAQECRGFYLADPVRLKQIMGNLITNAIKFTDDGYIRTSVRLDGVDGPTDWLLIEVEDTGCGLDKNSLSKVFDPFVQNNGRKLRSATGTGLGLTIAKSLVELHGGEIGVRSVKDKGSTFWCRLPLTRCESRRLLATTPVDTAELERHVSSSSLKILLAEDHPVNQRVVQLILKPLGCDIMIAENGQIAVDCFSDSTYDLVLMDLQMPVMDGLEATRQIRNLERETDRKVTPIVVLSASAMQSDVEDAIDAGADRHLSKPVTPDRQINCIIELLNVHDAQSHSAAE